MCILKLESVTQPVLWGTFASFLNITQKGVPNIRGLIT